MHVLIEKQTKKKKNLKRCIKVARPESDLFNQYMQSSHTHAGRGEELLLLSKKTFSFRFSTFDEREVSTLDAESRKDTFDQI